MFIPGYGKKGMGWWRNPKKAFYNWWYHRTSVSLPRMLGYKPSRGGVMLAFTVACFLDVFAAPFDIVKAATKAHKRIKASRRKLNSNKAKKSNSTKQNSKSYTTIRSDTTKTTTHSNRQATTKTSTESKTISKTTNIGVTHYSSPTLKEETKTSDYVSTERIRLFEMPSVKVEEKPMVVEPDENTPKSTPKHENDQYIRKRMIIAGTSYCDQDVLEMLKVGTYLELETEPDNPYDKDAIKLTYNGHKIGYIPKQDRLAFVTCLKLNRNIYGVITAINDLEFPTKYEFETWFDLN
jgi:hypothetical protein